MSISLISTVYNEGRHVRKLLDSVLAQTMLPDEIIIVDGGSRDDTLEHLQFYVDRLPLQIIVEPGANISSGRNVAIGAARGDIIALTDCGVRLDTRWLEEITRPLREDDTVQVVAGFFEAAPETAFEVAMGATVLPHLDEIDPKTFLPSSRSLAIRREAWAAVGGYPEWLDYCEDLIFDFDLRDRYGVFAWAPAAVAHFRPRRNMRSFARQYYRYARGDGKANLWFKRHVIRYGTYLIAAPLLLALGKRQSRLFWLPGAVGFGLYLRQPYRRLFRMWEQPLPGDLPLMRVEKLYSLALIPLIRVTGDIAKMLGYPTGVWWRIRRGITDS